MFRTGTNFTHLISQLVTGTVCNVFKVLYSCTVRVCVCTVNRTGTSIRANCKNVNTVTQKSFKL